AEHGHVIGALFEHLLGLVEDPHRALAEVRHGLVALRQCAGGVDRRCVGSLVDGVASAFTWLIGSVLGTCCSLSRVVLCSFGGLAGAVVGARCDGLDFWSCGAAFFLVACFRGFAVACWCVVR